jgi:uncharacterized protein YlxW (UPF0749 family)
MSDLHDSSVEPAGEKKSLTVADAVKLIPDRIFKREALMTLVLLFVGGIGAIISTAHAEGWVGAVAQKRVEPIIKASEEKQTEALKRSSAAQQANLDARVAELKADIAEVQQQAALKEERDGKRFEFLINTVLTGKYQQGTTALTRPPDGGN